MVDLLDGAVWEVAGTAPGAVETPELLGSADLDWLPATVPGTVAGALRAAGRWTGPGGPDLEVQDWWFRASFRGGGGRWRLRAEGLATIADLWLDGGLLGSSESMFVPQVRDLELDDGSHEIALRFAALRPLLATKHPRGRWRTSLVPDQHLRWYRATLLGRVPGWAPHVAVVGPWRPVQLVPRVPGTLLERHVRAWCDGDDGLVHVRLRLSARVGSVQVRIADVTCDLELTEDGAEVVAEATVHVPGPARWWPHTHGTPALHDLTLIVDGVATAAGRVGFRTIEARRADGDFSLVLNGTPIFCRGACWTPPDPVGLFAPEATRTTLEQARDAGMNMIRIAGTGLYEGRSFWDECDELGMLVWQDLAFANVDPPDDERFTNLVEAEVAELLDATAGRPSLAVLCGGSEVGQQAAMVGLSAARRALPLFEQRIPGIVAATRPDVAYLPSTPWGGDLPFRTDIGVSHYYGVGGYLRPLDDVRRAGVRFASECLAIAVPPHPETVEEHFGGAGPAGHDPRWKATVPRDHGSSWDFEDVRDHYVRVLFGVEPSDLRRQDPNRALDLGRAVVAELCTHVLSEWRRTGSTCLGALLLQLRDTWPGAGWGIIDAAGRPKAPYWALRRMLQPVAVLAVDEGLNGLDLHVVNDRPEPFLGTLELAVHDLDGRAVETTTVAVDVPGAGAIRIGAEAALGGFRDLNHAYRFGPRTYDVVVATLRTDDDVVRHRLVHLLGGPTRPVEPTVGLAGSLRQHDGGWTLDVTADRLAQYVQVRAPGWTLDDDWFHVPPGGTVAVVLRGSADQAPEVELRALNARATASVHVQQG